MSLHASSGELNAALKTLREHWEQVREVWRDGVAEEFENTFWKPIAENAAASARAMERLAPVLGQALRECE